MTMMPRTDPIRDLRDADDRLINLASAIGMAAVIVITLAAAAMAAAGM
jgi:hypothetical protein